MIVPRCDCGHPCMAHAWEDVPSDVSAPCDLCDCGAFVESSGLRKANDAAVNLALDNEKATPYR